jgi:hypothetical protein
LILTNNSYLTIIEINTLDGMNNMPLLRKSIHRQKKVFKCYVPSQMVNIKNMLDLGNLAWRLKESYTDDNLEEGRYRRISTFLQKRSYIL